MTLLTRAKFEWFENWKDAKLNKRGFDYEELKRSMAKELRDWALVVFPQLRDKVLRKYSFI
jgi:all-trans-retinol 13,14-reductase